MPTAFIFLNQAVALGCQSYHADLPDLIGNKIPSIQCGSGHCLLAEF